MIKVDFKINKKALDILNAAHEKALPLTVENLSTAIESAQVVPMRDGVLKDSESHGVIDGRGFISWNTPYARRLYFHPEYNFSKLEHANARGLWCDYWIYQDGKKDVINAYGKLLKMCAKGVIK
ncbi:hypothetical protein [Peptostreptococcus porci]|uniref:hypothetical protein n=1 Tax=Peptostreptococcus porci TaxID=2652282 RepID=UPI002A7494A9|nr:hypothetical protein [Peptostreptococcus porci]MDY2793966.1 hypothetical protein [Peptostreptococcus porci]